MSALCGSRIIGIYNMLHEAFDEEIVEGIFARTKHQSMCNTAGQHQEVDRTIVGGSTEGIGGPFTYSGGDRP